MIFFWVKIMDYDITKILTGNSIQPFEVDDEDFDIEQLKDDAVKGYWGSSVINSIGKNDFKNIFNVLIDKINIEYSLDEQKDFCYEILKRLKEVYDFELIENYEIDSKEKIEKVFELLEFIEFKNKSLIENIWIYIATDLTKISLEKYCYDNKEKIIEEINEQSEQYFFNDLIIDFLKNLERIKLLNWFIKNSIEIKNQIKINILLKNQEK